MALAHGCKAGYVCQSLKDPKPSHGRFMRAWIYARSLNIRVDVIIGVRKKRKKNDLAPLVDVNLLLLAAKLSRRSSKGFLILL